MNEKESKDKDPDEIDLYELLLVLKRRIKYIIGVFLVGILIGGVVAFLSPNIYQARATLWVDSLIANKFSFIIPLGQTKTPEVNNLSLSILGSSEFKKKVFYKLKESYGYRDNAGLLNNDLFKAEIDKKTGSINLASEQKDRKRAEDILKIVIEEFEKELDKVSQAYSEALSSKREKINKNKNFIVTVIEKPNSSESPVKPKRKLIVTVSGISALFSGIFLAFIVEWWSNVRRRRM